MLFIYRWLRLRISHRPSIAMDKVRRISKMYQISRSCRQQLPIMSSLRQATRRKLGGKDAEAESGMFRGGIRVRVCESPGRGQRNESTDRDSRRNLDRRDYRRGAEEPSHFFPSEQAGKRNG